MILPYISRYIQNNSIDSLVLTENQFEFLSALDYFYVSFDQVDACTAGRLHILKGYKVCILDGMKFSILQDTSI